ncbi:MAG: MATE family efflux transporter [Planctomycetota bacterium]|jgi:MATE family multidrug resistance protein
MDEDGTGIKTAYRPGGVLELLTIALPMVVSHACETTMMFVDRLFLSRLGPGTMGASWGGGLSAFMFTTFFMGIIGYANALVAQHLGAKQKDRCAVVASQAFIITIIAYPIIVMCIPLGHWMFALTKTPAEQIGIQREYFNILMYGAILGLMRNAFSSFFSGIGKTRIVMVAAFVAMSVNIFFNYVLIFGKLGFPEMGVPGAALGTVIGSGAGLAILVWRYFGYHIRTNYNVISGLCFDAGIMKKLLRYGSPSGAEFFLNILAFTVLVLTFGSYDKAIADPKVVADAVAISFSWDMVSFIPMIGIGIGVTSLVGRYMGAGKPDTAHKVTMSGLKVAVIYTSITFTAFVLFPGPLVSVFGSEGDVGKNAEIAALAVFMVRLISLYVFADAMTIVFGGALRGAGDTFWTMVISVSGHWVLAGAALIMIHVVKAPPRTAWFSVIVLILGVGLTFFLRYRSGRWRKLRVIDEAPAPALEGTEIRV